jgi:hypothetical protein
VPVNVPVHVVGDVKVTVVLKDIPRNLLKGKVLVPDAGKVCEAGAY